jgi:hypothetical protein
MPPTSTTVQSVQITVILTPTFTMLPDTNRWLRNLAFADPLHGWIMRGDSVQQAGGSRFIVQQFLATSDGGSTWVDLPVPNFAVQRLIFDSPLQGWAVTPTGIEETLDGGRSWAPAEPNGLPPDLRWREQPGVRTPCNKEQEYPDHFSFIDATSGWALCVGQPGAGHQHKQLFHTQDGASAGNWSPTAAPVRPQHSLPVSAMAATFSSLMPSTPGCESGAWAS